MKLNDLINLKDIVSMIVGGLITWGFSYAYYEKAGKDLTEEAKKLRQLQATTLQAIRYLQQGLPFEVKTRENGDVYTNVIINPTSATQ